MYVGLPGPLQTFEPTNIFSGVTKKDAVALTLHAFNYIKQTQKHKIKF